MASPSRPRRRAARTRTPAGDVGDPIIGERDPQVERPATWTLADIARELQCSRRHAATLRALGKLPEPIEGLLPLLRFDRRTVERWIACGCPSAERFATLERDEREARA